MGQVKAYAAKKGRNMILSQSRLSKLETLLRENHRVQLEAVRDELEKPENQQYVELIGHDPTDSADQAVGDALADINLAMIDRQVCEIRDIEAALARLKAGNYGSCSECGKEIGYERLLAYPTAKRCIGCQQQREKLYTHPATPSY